MVSTAGYRIDDRAFEPAGGVPTLGQHTRDVLAELGVEASERAALFDAGVVY